ncbi:MAG TPA: NUDIX domain-containing protein [Flavisolibacter sp.]|jgi:8-oxo-dGTP pyrophosphatase MutT (NUDIX family)|nr:NUDIX domain-containing protein [Flavisolibacter sp.]
MQISTAGLLVIKDRRLLLAFSKPKQCYYLPGGKVNEGETFKDALCREIEEELNVTLQPSELIYYAHISAPAFGEPEGVIIEQECFLVKRPIDPQPSAEVGSVAYFTFASYSQEERQAIGTIEILKRLQSDGLID